MRPRRRRSPLRLSYIGVLVVLGSVGCLATHQSTFHDARPADRVRLTASEAFEVRPVDVATAIPSTPCLATRLGGRVARVAGDTIFLDRAQVFRGPHAGRGCKWSGPSYVVRTEAPGLALRQVRVSAGRTTLLVLVLALPAWLASIMVYSGGFTS